MDRTDSRDSSIDIRDRVRYAARLRNRYRRRLLAAWWRWLLRALRHRRGAQQLCALDERALHDLGLTRSNIDAAARGRYRT
ncbi:MAG: hypothetical protein LDL19_10825 [Thiobacillus sp.]|nr:hypothetical protein [Thiobacillus sp.]